MSAAVAWFPAIFLIFDAPAVSAEFIQLIKIERISTMRKVHSASALFSLLLLFGISLPALAAKDDLKDKVMDTYYPVVWPQYGGPKVGVAVLTFEDGMSSDSDPNWINADSGIQVHFGLGDGIANILVSTLLSTNRFSILDKKIARQLFDLYSTDTAKKIYATGTGLPKVPGIKYFVLGSLTAFDDGSKGAEGGVGFGGVKLSAGKQVATMTIHMRIIDASSGQVVYSRPVEGTASVSKAGIEVSGANFSANMASPIGQAMQKMVDKATDDIIMKSFPGTASAIPPATP